jgi:hypothetical protein
MQKNLPSQSAEENRRRFPEVAAFVDECRKFWPDAQVVKLQLQPAPDVPDGPVEK